MEHSENYESPGSPSAQSSRPAGRPAPPLAGHMPATVDPLVPPEPDNAFTETRRLRHDGWTPEKKRLFLERFAECGILVEACEAVGMSARAAYNLRDRDPLFAAGLEAARVMARGPLADEAYSRARNGVVERIYRDGVIVAERHRYDNRLTMSVLARLDSRIDRAEEKGSPHLALVERWDEFLDALSEDRLEDGLALLAPPTEPAPESPRPEVHDEAGDRELHELHDREDPMDKDLHEVWEEEDGWWTDYPPPPGFDGEEEGEYGDPDEDYRRRLSPAEQAVIDSDVEEEDAEDLARAEAQRDAWFGFRPRPASEGGGDRGSDPPGPSEADENASAPAPAPGSGTAPGTAAQAKPADDQGESGGARGKDAEGEDDKGPGGQDDKACGPAVDGSGAGVRPPTPPPPRPPATG